MHLLKLQEGMEVFAPSLFTGGTIGFILARTLNNLGFDVHIQNFTLVGMAGMAAGMMHAPLTAIFLIAEITGGYELYIPLMIVGDIFWNLLQVQQVFLFHYAFSKKWRFSSA